MARKRIRSARRISVLAVGTFTALLLMLASHSSALADPTPTLNITTPATAEGPVGANVTITGQGFTASDVVEIGYISADQGCAVGDIPLNPALPVTVGPDGSFSATFPWPSSAPNIGASYAVCANDTTTPGTPVQSAQAFKVDASQAPSITLAPGPGPDGGTPIPGASSFIIGGQIVLTAANYQPGGKPLVALLLQNQYSQRPSELTDPSVVTLSTADASAQLAADASGAVIANLVLPPTLAAGNYWLYLVSSDGSPMVAPSLIAGQQIAVEKPAATPTPTKPATPTPQGTHTPSASGGKRIVAIVGLGGLSVLFLILGVIFLTSAMAMPRQPPQ